MSERMMALVAEQPGFLGVESARDSMGIYYRVLLARPDLHQAVEGAG